MNVVVVGAGGFLGSWIVRKALGCGHRVLGISRAPFQPRLKAYAEAPQFFYEAADVTTPCELSLCAQRFKADAIVHAAALGVLRQDAAEANEVFRANVLAGVEVARAARETNAPVIWIGTCMEYSSAESPITEDSPTGGFSTYGVAKNLAWRAFLHECGQQASFITLRPFYIFGPGGDRRRFATAAALAPLDLVPNRFGDASLMRDFVFLDDCVDGVLSALESLWTSRIPSGLILNLCSGQAVSLGEFARTAAVAAGKPDFQHHFSSTGGGGVKSEPPFIAGRPDLAAATLGWRARTPLLDGIKQMVAFDVMSEVKAH